MNKSELKETLADAINHSSLKEIIEVLIDLTTTAAQNNPGWEWETEAYAPSKTVEPYC